MTGRELLRRYLKGTGQKPSVFANKHGFDDGLFSRWLSGGRTPGLRSAFVLQKLTNGGVPASSWIGTSPPSKNRKQ